MSIQEEILEELELRTEKYIEAMRTETEQYPAFMFVTGLLKYLDSKNVRIREGGYQYRKWARLIDET